MPLTLIECCLVPNYISVGEICPQDGPKCPKMTWDGRNDERCVAKRARGLSAPIRHGHPPDRRSRPSRWNLRQICPVWLPGNRTRIKIHSSGRDDPLLECRSSCSQWRGWRGGKANTGWTYHTFFHVFQSIVYDLIIVHKNLRTLDPEINLNLAFSCCLVFSLLIVSPRSMQKRWKGLAVWIYPIPIYRESFLLYGYIEDLEEQGLHQDRVTWGTWHQVINTTVQSIWHMRFLLSHHCLRIWYKNLWGHDPGSPKIAIYLPRADKPKYAHKPSLYVLPRTLHAQRNIVQTQGNEDGTCRYTQIWP